MSWNCDEEGMADALGDSGGRNYADCPRCGAALEGPLGLSEERLPSCSETCGCDGTEGARRYVVRLRIGCRNCDNVTLSLSVHGGFLRAWWDVGQAERHDPGHITTANERALVTELEALRRVVRRLPAGQSFAAALRAAGDEPGAAAVERALGGGT